MARVEEMLQGVDASIELKSCGMRREQRRITGEASPEHLESSGQSAGLTAVL